MVKHFRYGHSDLCEAVLPSSFDLHFLIISNDEHFWICLLAICISSLEKCLFRCPLPIVQLCCFFLLLLNCKSCLYILEIRPLSVTSFANIFFWSVGYLFVLFMVSFAVQKRFEFD